MSQLHLSSVLCSACALPMVEEWVGYWVGRDAPMHASCDQFARRWAEDPDQFVPASAPAES
jgi:hypothetical protein